MPEVSTQQSEQTVKFASDRSGQQVGDGECYALADQALKSVGAKSADSYGKITPTADYVWGSAVTVSQTRAGDVIQFKNYTVTITTTTRITKADGSWEESTETQTLSRPHHTAIVAESGSNGAVSVYEQNVNGSRAVQLNQLEFVSRDEPPQTTSSGGTKVTVTRSVKVTGTAKFYRPQAK
ncbi:MAG TPA: hypothetical protein VFQ27_09400 [Xanthobacteraceae bacterium]|nr:hypothetical protein [Xanthobacteraceae bacterium]